MAYGYLGDRGTWGNSPAFGSISDAQLDGQWKQTIAGQAGGGLSINGPTAKSGGSSGSRSSGSVSNTNQAAYDPWSKYRGAAGDELAKGKFGQENDPSTFYKDKLQQMSSGEFNSNDPSYKWRFQQGQQAVERSLAAKGFLGSGNAAIELQQYGQGAASQEYGAQFDRMLKGLAGVSQQYDSQQQRLMAMAGINLDPTSSAKLDLQQQGINNDYDVGMAKAASGAGGGSGGGGSGQSVASGGGTSWGSYWNAANANSAAQTQAGTDALGNNSYSSMWGSRSSLDVADELAAERRLNAQYV
jgi:hypothetical protein